MAEKLIFRQLFDKESSTYTYLIADPATQKAALIDTVSELVARDLKLVRELGLDLIYVIDTHVHADHVTGAGEIRRQTSAKSIVSCTSQVACADIFLRDGQELDLGQLKIKVIATPGHTDTCMSFYVEGCLFTGDAILVRGSGRTDFQNGSAEQLFESVRGKLFRLPNETKIFPAHDYKGFSMSTIGEEKAYNENLAEHISKEQFCDIMKNKKLAVPKQIQTAVPANLACGRRLNDKVAPRAHNGVREILPAQVASLIGVILVDVREETEFNSELGHIKGALLHPLGPRLTEFLNGSDREQEVLFICRSGARAELAVLQSQALGFSSTALMVGGMQRWQSESLPIERSL